MFILFQVPLINKNGTKSMHCIIRGKFVISPCRKSALFWIRAVILLFRAEILPCGPPLLPHSCAEPFLGVVQKYSFLGDIYTSGYIFQVFFCRYIFQVLYSQVQQVRNRIENGAWDQKDPGLNSWSRPVQSIPSFAGSKERPPGFPGFFFYLLFLGSIFRFFSAGIFPRYEISWYNKFSSRTEK